MYSAIRDKTQFFFQIYPLLFSAFFKIKTHISFSPLSYLKSPIARSMWGRGQFGGKRYNLKKDLSHEQMFTNICFVTLFKHVYNNASITISSQIWDMNINERIKKNWPNSFPSRDTYLNKAPPHINFVWLSHKEIK